ncbi:uncharacterized protein [Clytia hemisphaerica]|uniref:Gustatory receptor n=1 Tax=Clytia hemisphaerica TaxID=252671 RepID=A0A7M5X9W3_9CNID
MKVMVKPFKPIEFHNNGYIASPLTKRVAPQVKNPQQQGIGGDETIIDIGDHQDYEENKIEVLSMETQISHIQDTNVNIDITNTNTPSETTSVNGTEEVGPTCRLTKFIMDQKRICSRKPILKRALNPCLNAMKLVGLYYDCEKGTGIKYRIAQLYVVIINCLILLDFIMNIATAFLGETMNDYYMLSILIIYSLKGVIQANVIHYVSRKCVLWKFIRNLNEFLTDIKVSDNVKEHEKRFRNKTFLGFLISSLIILAFSSTIIAMIVHPSTGELSQTLRLAPFVNQTNLIYRYAKTVTDIMMLTAWVAPITLCLILINSLTYTFEEFYRYLDTTKENVCRRFFLYDTRKKFLRLTELCGDFDDMMSFLLMFSYLLDIVMICLLLRMVAFSYTEMVSRLVTSAWLMLPIMSLMILSNKASELYDTGQKMQRYIQDIKIDSIDLDTKTELDLLLFHMSSEPVVMTIWKMIPLNRSIIVSIFVSIVTYFAMLISFL